MTEPKLGDHTWIVMITDGDPWTEAPRAHLAVVVEHDEFEYAYHPVCGAGTLATEGWTADESPRDRVPCGHCRRHYKARTATNPMPNPMDRSGEAVPPCV